MSNDFSFGAIESKSDKKRIFHEELRTMADPYPVMKAGYSYAPEEIEHQHKVGICTAISLTQNTRKAIGIKFSADFQYLLQKKYYDSGWWEGSSILHALKVGTKYGFLPESEWTWTTENDRLLPYDAYVAKLKAVPEEEIQRLIKLCSDYKLTGYAQVAYQDPQAIAKALQSSRSGLLCMYVVDEQWWSPSWSPKDINPLRAPKTNLSGHAIIMESLDYTKGFDQVLPNTWGTKWNRGGKGDINWSNYKMRECWIPYYSITEVELQDLKKTLYSKLSLLQKILELLKTLKLLKK
jgi:hypothetical protein